MNTQFIKRVVALLICTMSISLNAEAFESVPYLKKDQALSVQQTAVDAIVASGTTYYVSDQVSLDESRQNGGKSKEKPISITYFNQNIKLKPGDTVKFKNGSKFNQEIIYNVVSDQENEQQRVTFTNYKGDDNSDELPQFSLYKIVDDPSSWRAEPSQPNLWYIDFSDPSNNYKGYRGYIDDKSTYLDAAARKAYNNIGYIYDPQNNKMYGSAKSKKEELKADYDYYSYSNEALGVYRLYVYCHQNPSTANKVLYFTDAHTIFDLKSHTTISNLKFSLCGGAAISNGRSAYQGSITNDVTISNCEIDKVGGSFTTDGVRSGNGIELIKNGNHVSITNNNISNCYNAAVSMQGVNGNWENIAVKDNTLMHNGQSFEVGVSVTDAFVHQIKDVKFENNFCMEQGRGWSSEVRLDQQKACDISIQHMGISSAEIKIDNNVFFNPVRLMYLDLTYENDKNSLKDHVAMTSNNICLRDDAKLIYMDEKKDSKPSGYEAYVVEDFNAFSKCYLKANEDKKSENKVTNIGKYPASSSEEVSSILEKYVNKNTNDKTSNKTQTQTESTSGVSQGSTSGGNTGSVSQGNQGSTSGGSTESASQGNQGSTSGGSTGSTGSASQGNQGSTSGVSTGGTSQGSTSGTSTGNTQQGSGNSSQSIATGKTYYVSDQVSEAQSAVNDGLSVDQPISILHLYRFIRLEPGDIVKFKNGSKFNHDIDCTDFVVSPDETRRITFTNYEDPDCQANNAYLPEFSLYKITDDELLWSPHPTKPNVWFIDFSNRDKLYKGYRGTLDYIKGEVYRKESYNNIGYIYDPEEDKIYGNRKSNVDQLSQDLDFCAEYNADMGINRTCVYCHENPSKDGRVLYFTDGRDLFNLASNINIENLNFHLAGGHAMSNNIYEYKCTALPKYNGLYTKNITIQNCIIDTMGGSYDSNSNRAGNGIECMTHGENIKIIGNKISNCYDTAITLQGNDGNWQHITIEDNTFVRNNQSLEVWSSIYDKLPHQMKDVKFEHNRCIDQGRGWGDEVRPDKEKSCDIEIQHMDISDADITINDNEFINPKRLMYLNISQPKYVEGFKNNVKLTNNEISLGEDVKIAYICYQDQNLSREPYRAGGFSAFAAEFSTPKGDKQTGNIVIGPSILTVSKLADQSSGGTISGLDPTKQYAYKLTSASAYSVVAQGATEIKDLPAGIYEMRCTTDQETNSNEQCGMITVREKSVYNDYITKEDMARAFALNDATLHFSNDERIKKVIKKAEEGDPSDPIRILLVGGSITYGYSSRTYRPEKNESYGIQFTRWLRQVFPNRQVITYDIGIPSSDSVLANARINQELSRYNPDIVFVDFAVNDNNSDWDKQHYASLLKKILNYETKPAVCLPMFSLFYHDRIEGTDRDRFSVSAPVHCEIATAYHLPVMRYDRVMQAVIDRIGDEDEAYAFIKALGYDYDMALQRKVDAGEDDIYPGETTHPGDEGHKMMAQLFEDYFESVLNDYIKSHRVIDESRLIFDGEEKYFTAYDDEILLNADTVTTTSGILHVVGSNANNDAYDETDGQTIVYVDNFTWYRVVPGKCADPYYDNISDNSGGTYIECDTLPCWESRTTSSALTFTNVKGKCIGVWCYYHLRVKMNNIPEHYRDMVKGKIHIELIDKDGIVTPVDKEMPTDPSAHAIYIELCKGDTTKCFKEITIKPTADNLQLGEDPNIQILGLAVSGTAS